MFGQVHHLDKTFGLQSQFHAASVWSVGAPSHLPPTLPPSNAAPVYSTSSVERLKNMVDMLQQSPPTRPRGFRSDWNLGARPAARESTAQHKVAIAGLLQPSATHLTGPVLFVTKLVDAWKLDRTSAAPLLGFESTDYTYINHLLDGHVALRGRDVKDRIVHLFEIRRTLSALFQDLEVENAWLRESQPMLDDRTPIDLMLEGSIENLLLVKEYVLAAAGR